MVIKCDIKLNVALFHRQPTVIRLQHSVLWNMRLSPGPRVRVLIDGEDCTVKGLNTFERLRFNHALACISDRVTFLIFTCKTDWIYRSRLFSLDKTSGILENLLRDSLLGLLVMAEARLSSTVWRPVEPHSRLLIKQMLKRHVAPTSLIVHVLTVDAFDPRYQVIGILHHATFLMGHSPRQLGICTGLLVYIFLCTMIGRLRNLCA